MARGALSGVQTRVGLTVSWTLTAQVRWLAVSYMLLCPVMLMPLRPANSSFPAGNSVSSYTHRRGILGLNLILAGIPLDDAVL